MLNEVKKREKFANTFLATAMALSAAQSPENFVRIGNVESPGVALMRDYGRKRGEAERNLDHGRVSHSARNKKIKTFKEFVEEAYLVEMRKEDKVRGKKPTPEFLETSRRVAEKTPEGWKVNKHTTKIRNPVARQLGMNHKWTGGDPQDAIPKPHSTIVGDNGKIIVGRLRGVKKVPGDKTPPERGTPGYRRSPKQIVTDRANKKAYQDTGGYNPRVGTFGRR